MYRKYIDNLIKWKNNPMRKPLIIWGARQVGKTYLIKNIFGEEYYKNKFIYIDCRSDVNFVNFLNNHFSVKEVLNYLELDHNTIINKDTLLIFDEAQECLPIITMMKYFYQEVPTIPVIVTGSMVRMKIQRINNKRGISKGQKFLFPIGKINQLTIFPMNFEEFLINKNKLLYDKIKKSYQGIEKLDDATHQIALNCFYDYLLIGGMPEAVDIFLKTNSYQMSREALKDLFDNYLADMELYQASHESIIRAKKIFENIYEQLNKESKNFKASLIEKNSKNREYRTPIDWLTFAFLIHKSSLLKEAISIPLINSNESMFRLYLADVGLFSYQSGINPVNFIVNENRNTLDGILIENYVANELIDAGYKLFYWKGKRTSEFEFVIEYNGKIIPLDVKKNRGSLNSLEEFKHHNKFDFAVKISKNKYGYDKNKKIITLPFYYLFLFLEELKDSNTTLHLLNNSKK